MQVVIASNKTKKCSTGVAHTYTLSYTCPFYALTHTYIDTCSTHNTHTHTHTHTHKQRHTHTHTHISPHTYKYTTYRSTLNHTFTHTLSTHVHVKAHQRPERVLRGRSGRARWRLGMPCRSYLDTARSQKWRFRPLTAQLPAVQGRLPAGTPPPHLQRKRPSWRDPCV
jgi:hypothetical protein